jgi:predicted glycosyltransferase involved in capsule biosynthesis
MVIKEFRSDLSDIQHRAEEISQIKDWPKSFPGFTSCNVAFRRSGWQQLGGFDWKYDGHYGGEDNDLHARAATLGLLYGEAPLHSCAVHIGVFYGNRGIDNVGAGYESVLNEP